VQLEAVYLEALLYLNHMTLLITKAI
jgi:hypothetical protein